MAPFRELRNFDAIDTRVLSMTGEEVARFASVLREAERLRAQIEEDEAAARTGCRNEPQTPAALAGEQPSESAAVAAA